MASGVGRELCQNGESLAASRGGDGASPYGDRFPINICDPFQTLMEERGASFQIHPHPDTGAPKISENKITLLPPHAEESDKSSEFRIREASLKNRDPGAHRIGNL